MPVHDILTTKLYFPPPRPVRVSRPRLIEQLNTGLHRKLTLVSAPAGFGKTTLVTDWIDSTQSSATTGTKVDKKIAWLSIDEGDNDPTRFIAYIIAALQTVDQNLAKGILDAMQSPQTPAIEATLSLLINEISALPGQFILVLDDYHLIEARSVHDTLAFLLENQPPSLHLVILTRADPRLPLARLRARDKLTEVRAADLRFTLNETAEFLTHVMTLQLSDEDIAVIEDQTEGWITGLHLAALTLQGHGDTAQRIKSFTGNHQFVLDYLIEEVLKNQSDTIQNFLLKTAILDRLTGSLCDAITGQDNGQASLESLERANLFIVPLDGERRWYRYHHMFADLLKQRLRRVQPEDFFILHIKAGHWCKNQGLNREAIKHLLAGKDYQTAAELIKAIAINIIQQGEHTTIIRWLNALPDIFVREQPYLCVLHARALQLVGQLETSEARLVDAENALDSQNYQVDETDDSIRGLLHSCRAYSSFMIGDNDQTISYAKQALDELPETATMIKAQTSLYLGIAYRYTGQLQAALEVYNEILPATQNMGSNSIAVLCYLHLGDLYTEMAQLHRAKKIYESGLNFSSQLISRPDMPFAGYVYVSIGRILRQWNQLEDAHRFTVKGLALCRDWNVADVLALSCLELAYLHQALGNDEQARASIQESIFICNSISKWGGNFAAAHQVKFDLARDDIESAENWAQTSDLDIDGDFEFHREIEYLVLARIFIAQKRFEEAHSLVERICQVAEEIGKRQTELEGLILLALLFSAQDETCQALVHLESALSIGEPGGYVRIFVDEGLPMARLLDEAGKRGIAREYVHRLLAAFQNDASTPAVSTKPSSEQRGLVEPLSEREIEVLQLIEEGLTNREIADRLYLSLNTVKVHTRNIYGKLGVNNRTQAVLRARDLGLLFSS